MYEWMDVQVGCAMAGGRPAPPQCGGPRNGAPRGCSTRGKDAGVGSGRAEIEPRLVSVGLCWSLSFSAFLFCFSVCRALVIHLELLDGAALEFGVWDAIGLQQTRVFPHPCVPSQLTLPSPVVSAPCGDDVVATLGRGSVA